MKTRALILLLPACVLAPSGCNESNGAFDQSPPVVRGTGAPGWTSGQGATPAFATAGVRGTIGPYELASLPEYSRLDAGMNIASAQPLLATEQWPQTPAPSLYDRRYLSLPSNPQNMMYIDPSAPRDPYWRYRYWR